MKLQLFNRIKYQILFMVLYLFNSVQAAEMDCIIEPNTVVNISTAVEGVLETIKVDRGDTIKKGQTLATLESSVEQANVNLAKTRYEMEASMAAGKVRLAYAERKLTRNSELHDSKFISTNENDEFETERRLAELKISEDEENQKLAKMELKRAIAAYKQRLITSPIDGIVVERFLSVGEYAQAQPVMKLASIDPLYVEIILHTKYYGHVKKGMIATVKPEAPIGGSYKAVVTHVDQVLDGESGTFGIRLELDNKDYKIPAGAECKAIFENNKIQNEQKTLAGPA